MSTIAPTGGQTAQGTPPVATPSAVVIEAGETAQAAAVGNIITGTVIGRDARGAVQLRTQNGVILLHTNARLPPGTTVTLQVQPVGAQLQAILLQVIGSNGRPQAVGIDPAFPHAPPLATQAAIGPQPDMVMVAEGATVTAIVLGPARIASPPAGTPQAPRPDATAAASPGAPSGAAAPAAPSPVSVPTAAPTGPAQLPAPPAPIQPGQPVPPAAGAHATPGGSPTAANPSPATAPPVTAQTPPPQVTPGAAAPHVPTTPVLASAPQTAQAPPPAAPTSAPVGTAATSIAATVVPREHHGTERAPGAARGVPPSVPAAGGRVLAAASGSGSAPPAASLAYATTQSATSHLQPFAAMSWRPLVEALHPAAPGRGALPAPLPPGSVLEVRVVVTAELASQPTPPGHTALPAAIVGRTPTGQGIVDTPAGRLAVPLPPEFAAAPVGTRLTLDVIAWRAAVAAGAPATSRAIEVAAVRPVLDAVGAIARATRGRVDLHEAMPRPGPRLAQQLADMAAALVTGDVAEWLGRPAVEALERRGQGELVRRLEHDLYDATRAAPQTPEWRGLILPFVVGDTLRPLRFYVRQRHERARDKLQGTRFVVECDHDEHGALQLDGLVHGKRIDLILRSHAPLADGMRGDLAALFGDACGVMGYAGAIEFQATPEFPAMPRAEPATQHVGVIA